MELPKPDLLPDPNKAKSPEEFAQIMELRGYKIDTENCPIFNSHKRKIDPTITNSLTSESFFEELKRRGVVKKKEKTNEDNL